LGGRLHLNVVPRQTTRPIFAIFFQTDPILQISLQTDPILQISHISYFKCCAVLVFMKDFWHGFFIFYNLLIFLSKLIVVWF